MLTNDEREFLKETSEDLKRILRRINRVLVIDATSNCDEEEVCNEKEEYVVTQYLIRIGVPTSLKGFRYIRSAILYLLAEKNRTVLLTKELYPKIAEEHNSSVSSVERAIRTAIERATNNKTEELNELLCGCNCTTCSEFLTLVTEKIRLGL